MGANLGCAEKGVRGRIGQRRRAPEAKAPVVERSRSLYEPIRSLKEAVHPRPLARGGRQGFSWARSPVRRAHNLGHCLILDSTAGQPRRESAALSHEDLKVAAARSALGS